MAVEVTQTNEGVRCYIIRLKLRLVRFEHFLRELRFEAVGNHILPLLKPIIFCLGPLIVYGQLKNQLLADKMDTNLSSLQIVDPWSLNFGSSMISIHTT